MSRVVASGVSVVVAAGAVVGMAEAREDEIAAEVGLRSGALAGGIGAPLAEQTAELREAREQVAAEAEEAATAEAPEIPAVRLPTQIRPGGS